MIQLFREQGALLVLIGLMFLIFFAQALFGAIWYGEWMAVPGDTIASWQRLKAGEAGVSDWRTFSTLLSCAFLHADIEHVAFNMLFLWIFGGIVSELLGWRWMVVIFLLTAIAASITHTAMNRTEFIPMLGASGAVMGFEGAYLGLATRWKLPNPHIWPISRPIPPAQLALLAVIGIAFDYYAIMQNQDTGIAYGAHVGGFTMGLLLAGLILPKPRQASAAR